MKKKASRQAAKAAPAPRKKAPVRRLILKAAPPEAMSPDEVTHLETLVKRFEESEKTWQRMTAPLEGGDPWAQVEEHMLKQDKDSERSWKYFSK